MSVKHLLNWEFKKNEKNEIFKLMSLQTKINNIGTNHEYDSLLQTR